MNINTAQTRPQSLNRPKPPVPLFNGSLPKGKETNSNDSKKQKVGQNVQTIPISQEHSLTQQPLSTFISGFFEQSASPASSVSDSSREKSSKRKRIKETPLPPFDFSFRDHSSICTDKLGPSSFSLVTKQESRKRNRGEVDLGEVDLLCTESLVADSSDFSFPSSQFYAQESSPRTAVDSSDLTVARIIFDEKLDRLDQPTIQTRRNREGDIIEKSIHNTQTILALRAAFNCFSRKNN